MSLKERIFSSVFLRNMMADLGLWSFSTSRKNFTPFFEYEISSYKDEFRLHFKNAPFADQYKNEIFNHLNTYNGQDIIHYLEYHYERYPDKAAFLDFLQREIKERIGGRKKSRHTPKLQTAVDWVQQKMADLTIQVAPSFKKEIQSDLDSVLKDDGGLLNKIDAQAISDKLVERIYPHLDNSFKEQITNFTASIPKSNISLNNKNHEGKLIEFFIIFSQLQYPIKGPKVERLFNNFNQVDIATLLNVNFEVFKNKKMNTIQKNVGQAQQNINLRNPKLVKLNEALSEYFFES